MTAGSLGHSTTPASMTRIPDGIFTLNSVRLAGIGA